MKKTVFLSAALSALFYTGANAQEPTQRTCGTADYVKHLLETNPDYVIQRQQIENFTNDWIANNPNMQKAGATATIPVVVHVLYNTNTQNISDAQVLSQIPALNADYRGTNSDVSGVPSVWQSLVADVGIEFCMATVDPNGAATNGITRTQTNKTSFSIDTDDVKSASAGGHDAWPRDKYLNIWVCNLSGGLLGYTTPPGGPAASDGVVIGYKYYGTTGAVVSPFNKGRTATHEIGHWFNLEHTWGDDGTSCGGSDQVSDTPNQAGENYGCPSFPRTDACSSTSPGVMFINYMDYVDDGCMIMFTNGQKTRMLAALNGPRAAIKTSNGCTGGTVINPPGGCDTLSNVSGSSTAQLYGAQDNNGAFAGFISGTNSFDDNAKADKFTVPSGYKISGALIAFGRAYTTNNTRKVTAAAWDATGTSGSPGTELVNKDILINSITENVLTSVSFSTTPNAPTAMYMGVRWTGLAATDSVAIITNSDGDSNPNTAWERWSDNTWHAYNGTGSWGLSVSHYIFPIVCPITPAGVKEEDNWEGVSVFPNPTNGNLNVYLKLKNNEDVNIRVFNPVGQIVDSKYSQNVNGGTFNFDLSGRSAGLYFVEITAGSLTKTFKIIVSQ